MIQPYLYFDGNCRKAVEFYANVFNVEQQPIMTYGEGPRNPDYPLSEEDKNRVMHTFIMIGSSMVMFSDINKGDSFVQGNNISLTYVSNDENEIRDIFTKLNAGGEVLLALGESFFSKLYEIVKDQFGIIWQMLLPTEH
ncbi:MAG: VOC family protein [Bacilli bacterium]|nr:VOC family protein [Bacilli bacterium]